MNKSVSLLAIPLALARTSAAQVPAVLPIAAGSALVQPNAPVPTSLPLTDFTSAAEIARFARIGIPESGFIAVGDGSARIVLEKFSPGGAEWPALVLRANKGLPANWNEYDVLSVEVRNEGSAEADLAFQVQDAGGTPVTRHFLIPAGKTETLRFPLSEMGKVSLSRIGEIHLFATRPPAQMNLVLRNLRLDSDPIARQVALTSAVAAVNATYDRPLKETRETGVREWIRQEQDASRTIQGRLLATQDRREQGELRSPILARETRVLQTVPRRLAEIRMRREFAAIDRKSPYSVGFATGMEKVFPADVAFQAKVEREARLALAGNETGSVQLLVLADKQELTDVQVTVGPLKRGDGMATLPASAISVAPVGFVKTKRPSYKVDYVGWYPDPILDFLDKVTVKAGEMQPIWVRVSAPPSTPAGDYKGTITVRPANAPPVTLNLTVTVWGFSLPDETHLRTAVSFREPMIEQVYGTLTEPMRQKYYRFLLKNRINPDNIYRMTPPRVSDLELWNREGMNASNTTYAVKPADLKAGAPYPAERKAEILAQLDAIVPELKARGLYEKAYLYGFDEVSEGSFAAMRDIFSAIKAKYPDLLILTTAYDATYGEKSNLPVSVVDGWVPLTPKYDPSRVAEARKAGKQIWWYTCIVPQSPYANWLIEYDAIEARSLMGLQTAKYKPDGFLYYAVNRWPLSKKPITFGPYTDWASESFPGTNGDGSFICGCPDGPLSTIRLENIRDGIEDNEYFWLLEQEITKLKASRTPEAASLLRQAEKAQEIGKDLVQDLTHFSKSPEAIYAKRRQVAEAILAAQRYNNR